MVRSFRAGSQLDLTQGILPSLAGRSSAVVWIELLLPIGQVVAGGQGVGVVRAEQPGLVLQQLPGLADRLLHLARPTQSVGQVLRVSRVARWTGRSTRTRSSSSRPNSVTASCTRPASPS
jgi:hypothetical protein